MGEGDGTVSLLSLGAMCVEGWKRERWNPAGIKIVTTEVRIWPVLCLESNAKGYSLFSYSFLIYQHQVSLEVVQTQAIMLMFLGQQA